MKISKKITLLMALSLIFVGCRPEIETPDPIETNTDSVSDSKLSGFYLLNEGNYGSNKASIDFFDFKTGNYLLNIFPSRNPQIVKDLGDVGNDLKIYGNRLYAVINNSNLVEVMDARTAEHIGTIEIEQCRYVAFAGSHGYVTSYGNEIAEFDTATLQITRRLPVGYQPEEMAIVGEKLYVANSGGYQSPEYDNRLMVVDLPTFTVESEVKIAKNLHRVRCVAENQLVISSRGDYASEQPKLFLFDTRTNSVTDTLNFAADNFDVFGGKLYAFHIEMDYVTYEKAISFVFYDLKAKTVLPDNFITDGTENDFVWPYSIAVNPTNGDFVVTDAADFVTPGTLHYYNADGTKKWSVTTGDVPSCVAWLK